MFSITCITVNESGVSIFTKRNYEKSERAGMMLSEQITAKNFRLRESKVGYKTKWHLAGDPTLILVQKGTLRITLRDNQFIDFTAGDMFIAADSLQDNIAFNSNIHGHIAEVTGKESLLAVHIKLDKF